jgi:hypothetical protein
MSEKQYPAVAGLNWRRGDHYEFFIPKGWHRFAWDDGRDGEIHGPDADDPLTIFTVDTQDLGTTVSADDLDALAEGFFGSIEALPEVEIEVRKQRAVGQQLELEAKYCFEQDGATRKRWARLLYIGQYQINFMAQGASPEKYDYWLPWFYEAMMTAKIHRTAPKSPSEA